MALDWALYTVAAAFLVSVGYCLDRFVLRQQRDAWAYGFLIQGIVAFIFGVNLLFTPVTWPSSLTAWGLALASGLIWAAAFMIDVTVDTMAESTLKTPLRRFQPALVVFLAAAFLGETLTPLKLASLAFILVGVTVASSVKNRDWKSVYHDPVVRLMALNGFLGAVASIIDKVAIAHFNAASYAFLIYLVPTIVIFFGFSNRVARIKDMWVAKGKTILFNGLAIALLSYLYFTAFTLAPASQVLLVFEINLPLTFLGGVLFLKERENLPRRALGATLVLIGSLLTALA